MIYLKHIEQNIELFQILCPCSFLVCIYTKKGRNRSQDNLKLCVKTKHFAGLIMEKFCIQSGMDCSPFAYWKPKLALHKVHWHIYFKTNSYTSQFIHAKNNQIIAFWNYSQSLQKNKIPPSKLNHASAVLLQNNHCFDLILWSFMLLRVLIILSENFVFNIWIFM